MIRSGFAWRTEAMNMNQIRKYVITKILATRRSDAEPFGSVQSEFCEES